VPDRDPTTPSSARPDAWEQRIAFAKKAAIWVLFLAICYILRHFFAIIFLTFILSFAGNTVVEYISGRLGWHRRLVTVLVAVAFVALVSFLFYFIGASFYQQAIRLSQQAPALTERVGEWYDNLPPQPKKSVQWLLSATSQDKAEPKPPAGAEAVEPAPSTGDRLPPARQPPATEASGEGNGADLVKDRLNTLAQNAVPMAGKAVVALIGLVVALLLSIIFSLLIVFDLPHVKKDTHRLRYSRVAFLYTETAETVVAFAAVVGRMFQAQAVIACINTLLTLLGLWILGVPNLAFLTVVVFLCSFIPIAGVFISSTPIVLVALVAGGGSLAMAIQCVVMVTIVHAVEAYVLNPRIMGAHLRLNPVFVLLILFTAGHLVGVWGVLLGVPVAAYIYQTVYHKRTPADASAPQQK